MLVSILYFFIVIFLLGFSISYLLRTNLKLDNIKDIVITYAIGLGGFAIVANIFNLVRIPLHWLSFLILSLIVPAYYIFKVKESKKSKFKFSWKKDYGIIIAIILGIILFSVYLNGATKYSYLEDDDPWDHALAAKYVAIEKTAFEPSGFDFHYLDPYPPTYDILMGTMHQMNNSMNFTLKFFNALLCGLAIIFFYIFASEIFKDKILALFSTFVIFANPSFMSHFIWSQTLAIVYFFPAWYFLFKGINNGKWRAFVLAGIMSGAILITQPSTAFIYTVMTAIAILVYFIFDVIKHFKDKEKSKLKSNFINYLIFAGVVFVIAGIYWFSMIGIYGIEGTAKGIALSAATLGDNDTSGGIVYSVRDFLFAPKASKMDQPTGLGWMIVIMLIPGIIYLFKKLKSKKEKSLMIIIGLWFVFTILGTQGNAMPFKVFPHRFWVFLAMPIALICGYGMKLLFDKIDDKTLKYVLLTVVIIGVLFSSAYPKYVVETSNWPPGARWTSYEEVGVYSKILNEFPKDTKIFMYTPKDDKHILGIDQLSYTWNPEVRDFKDNLINKTIFDTYDFLKDNEYEYMILGGISFKEMAQKFGQNESQAHIANLVGYLQNTSYFTPVIQNQGAVVMKVN